MAKYLPKAEPSLLKPKTTFANSKSGGIEKYPDEWITELLGLGNDIDKICLSTRMTDHNFMLHIFNKLTKEYNVVLGGMDSILMPDGSDLNKLTIGDI